MASFAGQYDDRVLAQLHRQVANALKDAGQVAQLNVGPREPVSSKNVETTLRVGHVLQGVVAAGERQGMAEAPVRQNHPFAGFAAGQAKGALVAGLVGMINPTAGALYAGVDFARQAHGLLNARRQPSPHHNPTHGTFEQPVIHGQKGGMAFGPTAPAVPAHGSVAAHAAPVGKTGRGGFDYLGQRGRKGLDLSGAFDAVVTPKIYQQAKAALPTVEKKIDALQNIAQGGLVAEAPGVVSGDTANRLSNGRIAQILDSGRIGMTEVGVDPALVRQLQVHRPAPGMTLGLG